MDDATTLQEHRRQCTARHIRRSRLCASGTTKYVSSRSSLRFSLPFLFLKNFLTIVWIFRSLETTARTSLKQTERGRQRQILKPGVRTSPVMPAPRRMRQARPGHAPMNEPGRFTVIVLPKTMSLKGDMEKIRLGGVQMPSRYFEMPQRYATREVASTHSQFGRDLQRW
jgi:hypothetical protein